MRVQHRLKALEQVAAPHVLGYLSFEQSMADPAVFVGKGGETFTAEQINALNAAGWCCYIWTWQETPELQADQHVKLSWGDE